VGFSLNGVSGCLRGLLNCLGFDQAAAQSVRYQLMHRTVAIVLEAEHYGSKYAAMIVQSFDPAHTGFADFQTFAAALGVRVDRPGVLSQVVECRGIKLRVGWALARSCCRAGRSSEAPENAPSS